MKKITNYICIALDTSGSMSVIRNETMRAYNDMLRTIREKTEQSNQNTLVALVIFDSKVTVVNKPTDIQNVSEMNYYPIGGNTALFDAVGKSVETIDLPGDDASYLVMVFTDGEENYSLSYNAQRIRELIQRKQALGNWTFAFQMPPGKGTRFASAFGIPADNIREWEATARGVEEARLSTQIGLASYFDARTVGQKAVRTFYKVTTDLSKVDSSQVKRTLTDISSRFTAYTVNKEEAVKEFVESKTRRTFVIGSVYYQLTKPETVQANKEILLMEKGKTAIYGGTQARELIGLPTDGGIAKVTPGNHSQWDIFVQSTSVNRKLVRGTRVLIDLQRTQNATPTWDHTSVAATV